MNIFVGGNVLSALALALPLLLYVSVAPLLFGAVAGAPLLHTIAIAAGFFSTIVVGLLGLARRGRLRRGWILALTLPYWICLSIAAWRAVLQYVWNPYRWEKTDHGLAKRSGPPLSHGSITAPAFIKHIRDNA